MRIPKKVVISQPFSGSLYAFFDKHLGGSMTRNGGRPALAYYRGLYGSNYQRFTELSLTLLVLFPDVLIAPADNRMPDLRKCETGGDYRNPSLRLYTSWKELLDIQPQLGSQISEDLHDSRIRKVLFPLPPAAKRQVLLNARYDIYLAMVNDCPIISAGCQREVI